MKAQELLNAAASHMRDRAATYDKPEGERSMGATVEAFNVITGRTGDRALSESEGWLLMQVLKDVRDRQRTAPHKDSLEDGIAYAALKAEARMREGKKKIVMVVHDEGNPWRENVMGIFPRELLDLCDDKIEIEAECRNSGKVFLTAAECDWKLTGMNTDILRWRFSHPKAK